MIALRLKLLGVVAVLRSELSLFSTFGIYPMATS
jgi:hypothetical protein